MFFKDVALLMGIEIRGRRLKLKLINGLRLVAIFQEVVSLLVRVKHTR